MVGGDPQTIADRIKDARHDLDLSQAELARILKTSPRMVKRWEHGRNLPGPKYRRLLGAVFGRPPSYFNGGQPK